MKKHLSYSNLVSLISAIIILLVYGNNVDAQQIPNNVSEKQKEMLVEYQLKKIDNTIKKEVKFHIEEYISELRQKKNSNSYLKSAAGLAAISESDSLALVELYNDTNGPSWTNSTNWLVPGQPISSWHGVVVNGDNITEIRLKENNLTGAIPAELGQLTSLEYLALDTNNLSGAIPVQLGNLTNLQFLYLDGNNLTGPIPVELGNLTNLTLLYLSDNQLSDTIPVYSNLASLEYFDLSHNLLTGRIPVQLGNLTNLKFLDLGNNLLTDTIPKVLDQLSNMIWLDLRSNQFSGSIPKFGLMPNLRMLYLNSNNLIGSIPAELSQQTNLIWLHLGQNQLTGSIPVGLSQLTGIEQLYLDGNQLTGSIPTELGLLTNLIWLNLSENQLTGSIPLAFSNLINLELLYLDNNQLTGSIPTEMGQISNLRWTFLNNNLLSDTIPNELGDLTNLEWLGLNDNQLTGSVPLKLTQLTNLLLLHLNGNQLDYLPEYTSPNNLTDLNVSDNKISFEDLEYNMGILSGITFVYSPQDSIGESLEFTKIEGDTFSYTLTTGGTTNSYQWYKDGVILPAQTTETLEINNLAVADAGNYYCEVTNTAVPDLTLTSREITLLMDFCFTKNFSAGWNIFSSPVMPADPNMLTIFQPFITNESLVKIQNEEGKSLENIFGDWNNNIGDMALTEGYKVKVSKNDTVEFCGTSVKYPYAIPLKTGWNIISYPLTTAFNGLDVVQQLINNDVLIKVQDENGNSIEYLSFLVEWTNSIVNFTPGEGYKVKVSADDTLWIYNTYPNPKSNTIEPELIPTAHYRPAFEGNGVDHMNIYLVNLEQLGIMEGDEIGIFDGNICVGATKITKQNSSYINLIASATDGSKEKVNGFLNGGDIILRLYRNGKEYPMSLQTVNNALLKFEKNGSVIAMATTDLTTGIETQENETSVNCYPNPFYENINIEINLQNEEILTVEIYDLYSRKIRQLHNGWSNGTVKLQWDGNDERGNKVATGVYFLRVNKTWKKVMLSGN